MPEEIPTAAAPEAAEIRDSTPVAQSLGRAGVRYAKPGQGPDNCEPLLSVDCNGVAYVAGKIASTENVFITL